MTTINSELLDARREEVLYSFEAAVRRNKRLFMEGCSSATSDYIYPNQLHDATNIVNTFYTTDCRIISVQKRTKVGADGLMIEIAKQMTTHKDDNFIIDMKNLRIITGMSNVKWEKDMIDKAPECFKENIYHHGKLKKVDFNNLSNSLIIIDEIDTGDGEDQIMHGALRQAGILDMNHIIENNNRFVVISATMIKELYDLYHWGDIHQTYKMTIPDGYCSHKDFLDHGIIREFYELTKPEDINKWIEEDIIDNYKDDYRIHIVRVSNKNAYLVEQACSNYDLEFRNHTANDKISDEKFEELFEDEIMNHVVIAVKGLLRRANLIPNKWKMRIGAIHERYVKNVDFNVQIQGLVGRMTGYWKDKILEGHKTGPYRTSIDAIEAYEDIFNDPFGDNCYHSAGFSKRGKRIRSTRTMLSYKNIANLTPVDIQEHKYVVKYLLYDNLDIVRKVCNILKTDLKLNHGKNGYRFVEFKEPNKKGFYATSAGSSRKVCSIKQALEAIACNNGRTRNQHTKDELHRTCLPCYEDTNDNTSIRYIIPIRYLTKDIIAQNCIDLYPPLQYNLCNSE